MKVRKIKSVALASIAITLAVVLGFSCASSPGDGASNRIKVTRAEFGSEWPFTIDEGEISCEGGGDSAEALYFHYDGKTYGLNGMALMDQDQKVIDLRESGFWAPDPAIPGMKINIDRLQKRAKDACPS